MKNLPSAIQAIIDAGCVRAVRLELAERGIDINGGCQVICGVK